MMKKINQLFYLLKLTLKRGRRLSLKNKKLYGVAAEITVNNC